MTLNLDHLPLQSSSLSYLHASFRHVQKECCCVWDPSSFRHTMSLWSIVTEERSYGGRDLGRR